LFQAACNIPKAVFDDWKLDREHCGSDSWPFQLQEGNADRPADESLAMLDYDVAIRIAELSGKRLMTEEEYVFAATNGGKTRFPWGDDPALIPSEWSMERNKNAHDITTTDPPIRGLYSGHAEWTSSWSNPLPTAPNFPRSTEILAFHQMSRVIRGVPMSVLRGKAEPSEFTDGPASRNFEIMTQRMPTVGVRYVRSRSPRYFDR
jgi:formylglycine-generating enzyme required for sulfatase activity